MTTDRRRDDGYPRDRARGEVFAMRFLRELAQAQAAGEVGPTGCWLLTVVVTTEDQTRYRGPVNFFNSQLCLLLGVTENTLDQARQRAVDAGWLAYEPGGPRRPGRYFVLIARDEEGASEPGEDGDRVHLKNCGKPEASGGEKLRRGCGESGGPPFPGPNPAPGPRGSARAFVPPTLDEVRAYCREAGLPFDPERFFDHYESVGWKVGKNAMKNWRAAARQWAKREPFFNGPASAPGRPAAQAWDRAAAYARLGAAAMNHNANGEHPR